MASSNSKTSNTYRENFVADASADQYDSNVYAPNSWSTLLWNVEQDILRNLLSNPDFVPKREHYVDFACGTGRLTEYLSPYFERSTGVDISPAMLERARRRVPATRFILASVADSDFQLDEPADLVTAFRFILNADSGDRRYALSWIRAQLRDNDSRVIVNNHANLWTHKAFPSVIRRIAKPNRERLTGNVLSHRSVVRMVHNAGFEIVEKHGLGVVGAKALKLVPYQPLQDIQRRAASISWLARLGEDQVYVLAPR